MPIQDLAREDVVTATQDAAVHELAETMRDEDVGSVVVTDGDTPVGIVTDRDLTTRVLAESTDPSGVAARDVMSTDLHTVGPDAGFYRRSRPSASGLDPEAVHQAAEAMSEHGIRRLPVCTNEDELAGIITADDLTELLTNEHEHLASVIQAHARRTDHSGPPAGPDSVRSRCCGRNRCCSHLWSATGTSKPPVDERSDREK